MLCCALTCTATALPLVVVLGECSQRQQLQPAAARQACGAADQQGIWSSSSSNGSTVAAAVVTAGAAVAWWCPQAPSSFGYML